MATLERPIRHGMLTKRSISKSKTTFNAKFQERWFVLTSSTLTYHTPNGQSVKGKINVNCIRCCEQVDKDTFDRSQIFQVVYLDKVKLRALYLQGGSRQEEEEWMQSIRIVTEKCAGGLMLPHFHRGAFLKKKWSCCKKPDKYDTGCCNTYTTNRPDALLPAYHSRDSTTTAPTLSQSSTEPDLKISKTNTVKRKLSLQNLFKSDSKADSDKMKIKINESVEEDVFSDGDISEDDASSFKMKHSLDSSGNSPGFDSGKYLH